MFRFVGAGLALFVLSLSALAAGPPNIVFILADDMGSGDVHAVNNSSRIPTPHLDSLAAEGMTLTNAHTGSAVCTPTRYGLMTGRYAWRTRLTKGVLDGYGEPLIDADRLTVAGFLRERGYHTGVIGKWHLGLGFARSGGDINFRKPVSDGPHTHGFDFSYIIPASLDFPPYVFVRDGRIVEPPTKTQPAQPFPDFVREGPRSPGFVMEDVLDHLLGQAAGHIRRQAKEEKPFFLYFAMTAPHKPVSPHARFKGRTDLGPYGDFVVQVDWTVGEVLKALEEAGVKEETLVIYTSDNGSFMYRLDEPDAPDHVSDASIQAYRTNHHRANSIYRGTKADIWEAGHRVPFLVRWPGHVKAGSRTDATICLTDFLATVAAIAGAPLPASAAEDSYSFLPLLEGKAWRRGAPVIHHSSGGMFAIREGQWKLVAGNGSGGREKPLGEPFARPYHLFDLEADPGETKNIIEQHAEVADRLEARLDAIRTSGRSR